MYAFLSSILNLYTHVNATVCVIIIIIKGVYNLVLE